MSENNLEPLHDALAHGVERFAAVADAIPQLVWVTQADGTALYYNKRWLAYTGLGVDETNRQYGAAKGVVHPDDLAPMWDRWSEALATGEPYEIEYRLRGRADGSYRWFITRAQPIRDENGAIAQWIGTCTDIDEHRRARDALEYIARSSDVLFESFDVNKSMKGLMNVLVPKLADFALVLLADSDGALRSVASLHRDVRRMTELERVRSERLLTPEAEVRELRRLREHRPRLIRDFNVAAARAQLWPYLASVLAPLEPHSSITIPLHARGATFGGLYVFAGTTGRGYDARDLPLFVEIGRRASIAVENARSYERERRIAETYQRASLPLSLSSLPEMRVDAVFSPGSEEAEIGGDWYDSTLLPNGSLLVSVGDVMGRGLAAAAIMARIRQVINVAAMYESDPSRVLDTADHLVREGFPDLMITAFVGTIDSKGTQMRYANAGHRAPLLRRRGGEVVELRSTGLPLGTRSEAPSDSRVVDLREAELLVLYTDGLVDDRRDAAACEARLREVVSSDAALHAHAPARFVRDACLPQVRSDDIALLTVRFRDAERWSFAAENAQAANDARADFVRFLRAKSENVPAIQSAEVVFGELVGNVVRHAPGPIDVALEWGVRQPVLHVIDRGAPFASRDHLPNDPLSEGGRGLFLAQRLSDGLSVEHVSGYGNHVAAQLRL
jgi:PAS domain S-box-containing protein